MHVVSENRQLLQLALAAQRALHCATIILDQPPFINFLKVFVDNVLWLIYWSYPRLVREMLFYLSPWWQALARTCISALTKRFECLSLETLFFSPEIRPTPVIHRNLWSDSAELVTTFVLTPVSAFPVDV
jgi:hypothetical protein